MSKDSSIIIMIVYIHFAISIIFKLGAVMEILKKICLAVY